MIDPKETVGKTVVQQTFVIQREAWIERMPRSVAMAMLMVVLRKK